VILLIILAHLLHNEQNYLHLMTVYAVAADTCHTFMSHSQNSPWRPLFN